MALTNKKDGETINSYELGKKNESNANKLKNTKTKNKK